MKEKNEEQNFTKKINHTTKKTLSGFLKQNNFAIPEKLLNDLDEKFRLDYKKIIYELIDQYHIPSQDLLNFFSQNYFLPTFDLNQFSPDWISTSGLKPQVFISNWTLPLSRDNHFQKLAIICPEQIFTLHHFIFYLDHSIQFCLVDAFALRRLIELHCRSAVWDQQLKNNSSTFPSTFSELDHDQNNDEPVIQFVNQLIEQGIQKKISDIHIEPLQSHYRLRFRQDGLLQPSGDISEHFARRVIARIKILAKLDITERRMPQDGRFQYQSQQLVHIRVSTSPSVSGEKIVLRLLEGLHQDLSLTKLGLEPPQLDLIKKYLSLPQGLIIVTGATGSGKTMTLYAALKYLNKIEKNICSVEDPVEIYLNGIHQVNVNELIHLDFPQVLRAFLRQDPDILMIGEIRDQASAQVAVEAAQTGHLVLTTLHTNSAKESILRFLNLKVPDFLLANALSLVISQRLIRTLCEKCKTEITLENDLHLKLHLTNPIYSPKGCDYCNQGYLGRTGIFEVLELNPEKILSLAQHKTKKLPPHEGGISLWQAGINKINKGLTSIEELYRTVKEV